MITAGVLYMAGVVFVAAAYNLAMLIIGRMLLGGGVGFATQVPAEMWWLEAPGT